MRDGFVEGKGLGGLIGPPSCSTISLAFSSSRVWINIIERYLSVTFFFQELHVHVFQVLVHGPRSMYGDINKAACVVNLYVRIAYLIQLMKRIVWTEL